MCFPTLMSRTLANQYTHFPEYQSPGLSETSEEAISRLVGGALEEVIFGGSLPERIVEAALEDVMG